MSSYCLRLASSPTTPYASEISLKRSAALGSFWFASGWCCLASRRYCFLISSWVAVGLTPSTA
jgi:hypothetical protein